MRNFNLRILLGIFQFLITLSAFSQDTIVKFSQEVIQAKILEITPTEIKYKKFNFQDGPLYVENKSDVKMIKYSNGVKEEFAKEEPKTTTNGTIKKDDYYGESATNTSSPNKIDILGSRYRVQGRMESEKNMQQFLLDTKDRKIIGLVVQAQDAKRMQYIGFAGIPLGICAYSLLALSTGMLNSTASTGSTNYLGLNTGYLTGSAVCAIAAIACPIISIAQKNKRNQSNRAAIKLYNEKF